MVGSILGEVPAESIDEIFDSLTREHTQLHSVVDIGKGTTGKRLSEGVASSRTGVSETSASEKRLGCTHGAAGEGRGLQQGEIPTTHLLVAEASPNFLTEGTDLILWT